MEQLFSEFGAPIVMGICLCLGYILKHALPGKTINRFIPLIAGICGVGMNIWLTLDLSPQVVLTGLVSGLASTGAHQLFDQTVKKK